MSRTAGPMSTKPATDIQSAACCMPLLQYRITFAFAELKTIQAYRLARRRTLAIVTINYLV